MPIRAAFLGLLSKERQGLPTSPSSLSPMESAGRRGPWQEPPPTGDQGRHTFTLAAAQTASTPMRCGVKALLMHTTFPIILGIHKGSCLRVQKKRRWHSSKVRCSTLEEREDEWNRENSWDKAFDRTVRQEPRIALSPATLLWLKSKATATATAVLRPAFIPALAKQL